MAFFFSAKKSSIQSPPPPALLLPAGLFPGDEVDAPSLVKNGGELLFSAYSSFLRRAICPFLSFGRELLAMGLETVSVPPLGNNATALHFPFLDRYDPPPCQHFQRQIFLSGPPAFSFPPPIWYETPPPSLRKGKSGSSSLPEAGAPPP